MRNCFLYSQPSSAFQYIKSTKATTPAQVPHIVVGDKTYPGDRVLDGLYESIAKLKTLDTSKLGLSPHHMSLLEDYQNIKYICPWCSPVTAHGE